MLHEKVSRKATIGSGSPPIRKMRNRKREVDTTYRLIAHNTRYVQGIYYSAIP